MAIPLTVVVPSVKSWHESWPAVEALLPQARALGAELILVTGHPDGLPEKLEAPVTGLHVPDGDVFRLRAAAAIAARGEIVALIEDHCYAGPDWCERLLAAWGRNPDADGLVGAVENGAPSTLDRASFLLTWAPFLAPLDGVPEGRCPPPGVVSYRRSVLPDALPPLGWLEYELPVELRRSGRMVADDDVVITHTQYVGLRAFALQYHAGRGFSGLHDHPAARLRLRRRVRAALGTPRVLMGQTLDALRTRPDWEETWPCLAAVLAFASCNALGQMVGILRGDAGSSLGHLE